jgi:hypothetical protein
MIKESLIPIQPCSREAQLILFSLGTAENPIDHQSGYAGAISTLFQTEKLSPQEQ